MFEQIQRLSEIMHSALDGLTARQRIVSNNLANADTPGFKAAELNFEEQLQRRLVQMQTEDESPIFEGVRTHDHHFPLSTDQQKYPWQVIQPATRMRNDGNSVDLELEMMRMVQANISYSAVSQLLSGRYSGLKYVIQEGGK